MCHNRRTYRFEEFPIAIKLSCIRESEPVCDIIAQTILDSSIGVPDPIRKHNQVNNVLGQTAKTVLNSLVEVLDTVVNFQNAIEQKLTVGLVLRKPRLS